MSQPLRLATLPETFAVCRLDAQAQLPSWASGGSGLSSLTRTQHELSVVCEERLVPAGIKHEGGWRALRVEGTLDFALTGILAGIAGALARAGVSLFAVSTFDTDYILVKAASLGTAIEALRAAGYEA